MILFQKSVWRSRAGQPQRDGGVASEEWWGSRTEEWILGGETGDNVRSVVCTPSGRGSLNTKRGWGVDVATFALWSLPAGSSFFVTPLLLDTHLIKGLTDHSARISQCPDGQFLDTLWTRQDSAGTVLTQAAYSRLVSSLQKWMTQSCLFHRTISKIKQSW